MDILTPAFSDYSGSRMNASGGPTHPAGTGILVADAINDDFKYTITGTVPKKRAPRGRPLRL
jgi:hypothetical protein